jgi:hypothetical protein
MTAAEAAGKPHVVAAIAKAAGVDRRTVARCLRGESPRSVVWGCVSDAAEAIGVALPAASPRAPRSQKPCTECARLRAQVEALEDELAELRARQPKLAVVPAGKAAG